MAAETAVQGTSVIDTPASSPVALPRWLVPVALGGLALYLVVLALADSHHAGAPVARLRAGVVLAVLGLSLSNYALRFLRWRLLLRRLEFEPATAHHLLIYVAGFALTVSPGKAGETVRCVYLRGDGVPVGASLAALFVERVLDLLGVALLALLLVFGAGLGSRGLLLGGGLVLTLAVIAPLAWPCLAAWLRAQADASARLGGVLRGIADAVERARALLRPVLLLQGLALGLIAWAAEGYGLWLLLRMMDLPVAPSYAIGAYALSLVAGAVSFLPGGVGGAEAALAALLVGAGVALPVAIAVTALCRLATLWFAVMLGLAAMGALHLWAPASTA